MSEDKRKRKAIYLKEKNITKIREINKLYNITISE